jgi:hypothetical protein
MPRRRDDRIDELLAEGRLGGPARDRVLARVLGSLPDAAPKPRPRTLSFMTFAALAAAGAVAVVLVVRPRAPADGGMRTKGARAHLSAAAVKPLCPSTDGVCRPGDRLMFRVEASPERTFLLAYADPVEPAAGAQGRVWIFPTPTGESPEVVPSAEPYFLRRAVEIDSSFPRGRYRLTIVLAKRVLTRDETLRASDAVRMTSTLVVEP